MILIFSGVVPLRLLQGQAYPGGHAWLWLRLRSRGAERGLEGIGEPCPFPKVDA